MKRSTFLASLFCIPASVKALVKKNPIEYEPTLFMGQSNAPGQQLPFTKTHNGTQYNVDIGEIGLEKTIVVRFDGDAFYVKK